MSCIPDVKKIVLKETAKFLIIASDGLWDVVSDEVKIELLESYYNNLRILG